MGEHMMDQKNMSTAEIEQRLQELKRELEGLKEQEAKQSEVENGYYSRQLVLE
jgi:ribosomal protein L29